MSLPDLSDHIATDEEIAIGKLNRDWNEARAKTIEECARELETSYPDHAWLNAACAAIRSLAVARPRTPKVRTSHHRNKEEATHLQALVDERLAGASALSRPNGETP